MAKGHDAICVFVNDHLNATMLRELKEMGIMAVLLTVNRYTHRAYTRTRDFNMSINGFMGMDLHGKTAGVIGTGRIGQAMIQILKGFGMRIIAYDPYPNETLDIEYDSIENVFGQADVITLHCPLTPETKHIVQAKTIEMMKDGVYLINTPRGDLIRTEDPNLARLTTFLNVLVTSHMGFFTKEAVEAIAEVTLNNADAVRNGRKLENAVQI